VTNNTFAERLERAVAASERAKLIEGRVNVMIDHQVDEEMILIDEVSDEAVEAAAFVALGGLPTIMYATYCFACPADPLRDRAIPRSERARLIEGHAIRDE
jgi:hypothetical protein